MQAEDPPWKIRTRLCPFYSQGTCFFAKNCSFLHQTESALAVIHVTPPDDSFFHVDDSDTSSTNRSPETTVATLSDTINLFVHSHSSGNIQQEQLESDPDSEIDEEDVFDSGSPTIRRAVPVFTGTDGSVGTVKADSCDSETRSPSVPPQTLSTPQNNSEVVATPTHDIIFNNHLLQSQTPNSATSATGQEVEVPAFGAPLRSMPHFTLAADANRSSLLTNRLAKSHGPPPVSSPAFAFSPTAEGSNPYSAGALYLSYHHVEPSPESDSTPGSNVVADATSPENVLSTPHVASGTHRWLRPLRLASALSPQNEPLIPPSSSTNSQDRRSTGTLAQSIPPLPSSTDASPNPLYESPPTQDSPSELYRRSSSPSYHIPTDTPNTIVLSDPDGYVSPLTLSQAGSLDIDMSGFPPPPSSVSGTSINGRSSSLVSISFSELTGRSPRTVAASQPSLFAGDAGVEIPIPQERATTAAEQLRSALERRTRRTQESSSLSSDFNHNSISASSGKSLLFDSTPSTSLSYSHNASAILDSPLSGETLPQSRSQSHLDDLRNTSTSDSLLQQAQSSPPRSSHSLISTSHVRSSTSPLSNSAVIHHTPSPDPSPRPQLLFAIASDQPTEVERLLSTGMASANETTGSGTGLLEFTVSNEGLKHKTEIVKVLLKYGADPNALKRDDNLEDPKEPQRSLVLNKKMEEGMNPALKYYLNRPLSLDVDSKPALEALQQSSFAPLARARFDIIGQDRVLDEFYRVLGTHSKRKGKNALVILLCGASGHGKSLLAQKVGSLLNVPTHTINMTALRSQHDLWQCLSTGIEDASPHLDLGEFLVENQGKRCVIVLDEMEKVDDPKSLNPLLLPWDIGRCSLEQKKHTDTSQAIWIATSNLGQQLIFEHVKQWGHPDTPPTRVEYTQLATAVRRRIAEVLGASLLSRVTIILPFLPFSEVEKIAIGTEAALWHQELMAAPMSSADIESIVRRAVRDVNLVEEEGARSLYRVVETHMIRA